MGLLLVIIAVIRATVRSRRIFLKSGGSYVIHLLVLSAMSHHFVSVGANKLAFNTMKMGGLVGYRSGGIGVKTVIAATVDITSELMKIATH